MSQKRVKGYRGRYVAGMKSEYGKHYSPDYDNNRLDRQHIQTYAGNSGTKPRSGFQFGNEDGTAFGWYLGEKGLIRVFCDFRKGETYAGKNGSNGKKGFAILEDVNAVGSKEQRTRITSCFWASGSMYINLPDMNLVCSLKTYGNRRNGGIWSASKLNR